MNENFRSIVIEGKPIHETPIQRLKSLWLDKQAELAAKPFVRQFQPFDRETNRGFFCFQQFLRHIIEEYKVRPRTAALIGWSVYQGAEKYKIQNGRVSIEESGQAEHAIDPFTEGVPLTENIDLFYSHQVKKELEIVALQGNNQERVYQIGLNPKKGIILERIYQLDTLSIFQ